MRSSSCSFTFPVALILLGFLAVSCSDNNPVRPSPPVPSGELTWVRLNPHPTSESLIDVAFVNGRTAFACGTNGTLLRTRDGGQSWEPREISTNVVLRDIDFVDSQTGWLVGDGAFVAITTDGGETWREVNSNLTGGIMAVSPISHNQAWVSADYGNIHVTRDGGQSWDLQLQHYYSSVYNVLFLDDLRGWTITDYAIYGTGDGGRSWGIETPAQLDFSSELGYYNMSRAFDGTLSIYGTGYSRNNMWEAFLLTSRDNGETWTLQITPIGLSDYLPLTKSTGVGRVGRSLYVTGDGGQTFALTHQVVGRNLAALDGRNDNLIAVGAAGTIVYSRDGGESWNEVSEGSTEAVHQLHFTSSRDGIVAGLGGLKNTSDGGRTWTDLGLKATEMFWLDDNRGWISDVAGNMYRTVDGGRSWIPGRQLTQYQLYDLDFVDELNGWNVGRPAAMRTRNGGLTWTVQYVTGGSMTGVDFVDTLTGWLCGEDGLIARSDDGGVSWQTQTTGTPTNLLCIQFLDSLTGWSAGDAGTILKTIDGGHSWQRLPSPTTRALRNLQFLDESVGFVVGDVGTVLMTTDGGQTWEDFSAPTGAALYAVFGFSEKEIWVGGTSGVLYQTLQR